MPMVGYDQQRDPPFEPRQYGGPGGPNMQNVVYATIEEPLTMTVVVPERATAGMKMRCTVPDGQELRLTVPEGVPPGSVMTLTQDPETKQWKCMAEPADDPFPPEMPEAQNSLYESGGIPMPRPPSTAPGPPVRHHLTSHKQALEPIGTWGSSTTAGSSATGGPTLTGIRRNINTAGSRMMPTYAQPMPVNLSYVPTPDPMPNNMMGAPGQGPHINSGPMPQVLAGTQFAGQGMVGPPSTLASDPSFFNPPRQQPTNGLPQEQRPS